MSVALADQPTQRPSWRSIPHRFSCIVSVTGLLAMLAACTNLLLLFPVPVSLPRPLIERLPLTVGVYYDPKFRSYEAVTGPWKIALGESSVALFDQAFAAMFDRVLPASGRSWSRQELGPDGIVEPEVCSATISELRWGELLATYEVIISYRLTLRSKDGERLAEWPISGMGLCGKICTRPRLTRATEEALRSAAADPMVGFHEHRDVQRWLQSRGIAVRPSATPRE